MVHYVGEWEKCSQIETQRVSCFRLTSCIKSLRVSKFVKRSEQVETFLDLAAGYLS